MAIKFASILAALGLGSPTEAVTEAHLEAADAKIAQLELDKKAADDRAAQAATALKTAQDEQTKTAGDLKTASDKLATLEDWKLKQKATDGREGDDSNTLDDKPEAQESWEKMATAAITTAKKRVGEK